MSGREKSPRGEATIASAVERYFEESRARGLRESTIAVMGYRLGDWLKHAAEKGLEEITDVTTENLNEYFAKVMTRGESRTDGRDSGAAYLREFVIAVKKLFKWAARRNLILVDPAAEIATPPEPTRIPKGILTLEEMKRLLEAPDVTTPVGLRNRALIELLYSSGLRREEAIRLDLSDVNFRDRRVVIREGKHGKDRVVPAGAEAVEWMKRYVQEARPMLEWNGSEQAFFLSEHGKRIQKHGIAIMLQKYRLAAKIPKWISPHSLRHTCATHLVQSGADIRYVQELLGHESIETTEIYIRVAPRDLEEAHRKHHPRGRKEPATP